MTIYSDNAGNKFLGNCIYANHSINYPSVNFLQAHPHSSISAELTALLTASGLQYRNVLSQANFDSTGTINKLICAFAPSVDTIDDRYALFVQHFFVNGNNGFFNRDVIMFNNSGYTGVDTVSMTNSVAGVYSNFATSGGLNELTSFTLVGFSYDFETQDSLRSAIYWCGVADNSSLCLFSIQYNLSTRNIIRTHFAYAGLLSDVNSNFNYYDQNINTKSILMSSTTTDNSSPTLFPNVYVAHYIVNAHKLALTTGDAQYPIACSDGQTPTAQWATDMYVFDDNATLGYPAIGRVRNLLLAQGTYTIGKPVRIQGSVMPDNGFNCWLPVGTFGGKVVLMRCYSSVSL